MIVERTICVLFLFGASASKWECWKDIVIVSLSHGWSQGKLRAFRYKIKIKIQFWFVIFKSQRHINEVSSTAVSEFVTRADNTIIGLGCDKNGSTKTPVIIKVDWVVALNAWDCCRNNLHFRVLFWPPEPAVWELFGFCWFASVCWIERGHFEFQTFPWLLDEKRFLLAKDIWYKFQTQEKTIWADFNKGGAFVWNSERVFSRFFLFRPRPVKGRHWTF